MGYLSPNDRSWRSVGRVMKVFSRVLVGLVYVSLCGLALLAGVVLSFVKGSAVITEMTRQITRGESAPQIFDRDVLTVLVLGCDEDRTPGGRRVVRKASRSDMMMVVRVDFRSGEVTGLSIPRDVNFRATGYSNMKINAYHAIGGKELAQRAVEELLGIPIDRTVVIDFDAFQQMVDLVGGVEVDVPKRLRYRDRRGDLSIDLRPGRQVLNGYDAMGFVRYRHGDSDFARQERQRAFLLAMKDRLVQRPEMLGQVADKAVEVLGGDFTPREVAALALFLRQVRTENIRLGMVPVEEQDRANLVVDRRQLRTTLREYGFLPAETAAAAL